MYSTTWPDNALTLSSMAVASTHDTVLRSFSMSCMSVENVGAKEGDVIFWDEQKHRCVGAYIFRVADSMARGQQRQFGIFVTDDNFEALNKKWPRQRHYIAQIVAGLHNAADDVMKHESAVPHHSVSGGEVTTSVVGFRRSGPAKENRPLHVLLQKPSLWEHFHQHFSWILRDGLEMVPVPSLPLIHVPRDDSLSPANDKGIPLYNLCDLFRLMLQLHGEDVEGTLRVLRPLLYAVITGMQVIVYGHSAEFTASVANIIATILPLPLRKVRTQSDRILAPFDANILSLAKKFTETNEIVQERSSRVANSQAASMKRKQILLRTLPECLILAVEVHDSEPTQLASWDVWPNYDKSEVMPSELVQYRKILESGNPDLMRTTFIDQLEYLCERTEWSNHLTATLITKRCSEWSRKGKSFCGLLKMQGTEGSSSRERSRPRGSSQMGGGIQGQQIKGTSFGPSAIGSWIRQKGERVLREFRVGITSSVASIDPQTAYIKRRGSTSMQEAALLARQRDLAVSLHCEECDIPVLRHMGSWKASALVEGNEELSLNQE